MTFARPKRINGRVPVLTAEEAVKYILQVVKRSLKAQKRSRHFS
ncbi:hypothetical protein AAA094_06240 [Sutterella wadsworthensis]